MKRIDETRGEPLEPTGSGGGTDGSHLPHGTLTNVIIGDSFEVHNTLGAGFLEAMYANALTVELRSHGVAVDRNVPFEILYRGVGVGRYVADLVVEQKVIVETKAAKAIDATHRAQVLNYLRASGLEVGLVVNFGTSVQFKRVVWTPTSIRDPIENKGHNSNSKT